MQSRSFAHPFRSPPTPALPIATPTALRGIPRPLSVLSPSTPRGFYSAGGPAIDTLFDRELHMHRPGQPWAAGGNASAQVVLAYGIAFLFRNIFYDAVGGEQLRSHTRAQRRNDRDGSVLRESLPPEPQDTSYMWPHLTPQSPPPARRPSTRPTSAHWSAKQAHPPIEQEAWRMSPRRRDLCGASALRIPVESPGRWTIANEATLPCCDHPRYGVA
ncbi:hypothetical protein EV121DRAFT_297575 [Schizophyllum commune]